MSSDLTGTAPGATPLDPDDIAGLIPEWVATRSELNAVEQDNIVAAQLWAAQKRWTPTSAWIGIRSRQRCTSSVGTCACKLAIRKGPRGPHLSCWLGFITAW